MKSLLRPRAPLKTETAFAEAASRPLLFLRVVLVGAFVLVMALLLSVFGAAVAQDSVTLRVWTGSSSPVENEFKEAQVAAFEAANPGINVELLISPDYGAQIRAAFATGLR